MTDTTLLLHQENLQQRRIWQDMSFFLAMIIIIETVTIGYLSARLATKREVVRYVEFSEKGNFGFKVLPASNINLAQRKLLIEQQLKQYVVNRVSNVASKKLENNEIDSSKVKYVDAFNSRETATQYTDELMRIYNEAEFDKRDIHILSYSEVEDRKYRFDFETIDTYPTGETDVKRWVVYIKYDLLDPNDLNINKHKELNPLGVKITYYRGDVDQQQKMNIENVIN